ncbi:MAG: DUF86 domain-containing protein [Thermoplasmatota archaeon]|nr:DUF86 domain-containing protein [Halobacteriales archaeon]
MRSDDLWMADLRDHAREAVAMAKGRTRADLDKDRKLELSLTRLLEVVGEAAAQLSPAAKAEFDLPWKAIIGMRNILVHAYHRVDKDEVWRMVTVRLPVLLKALDRP